MEREQELCALETAPPRHTWSRWRCRLAVSWWRDIGESMGDPFSFRFTCGDVKTTQTFGCNCKTRQNVALFFPLLLRCSVYKANSPLHSAKTRQKPALYRVHPWVPEDLIPLIRMRILTQVGYIFLFTAPIPGIVPFTGQRVALYFWVALEFIATRQQYVCDCTY